LAVPPNLDAVISEVTYDQIKSVVETLDRQKGLIVALKDFVLFRDDYVQMRQFEAGPVKKLFEACKHLRQNVENIKDFPHYHLNEKFGLQKDEIKRMSNHISMQLFFLHETKRIHSLFRHVKTTVENGWAIDM
jgi:hypothetical protein